MPKAKLIPFKPTPKPKSNLTVFASVFIIGAMIISMCNKPAAAGERVRLDSVEIRELKK